MDAWVDGAAVTKPVDARQNKQAVDAVVKGKLPAYVMILGGPVAGMWVAALGTLLATGS